MDADLPYELAVEPDSGAATAGYAGSNAASGSDGSASIVEIPIHWGLDDWEQYCYIPACSVPD